MPEDRSDPGFLKEAGIVWAKLLPILVVILLNMGVISLIGYLGSTRSTQDVFYIPDLWSGFAVLGSFLSLIAVVVFLPVIGVLAERFGYKRLIWVALILEILVGIPAFISSMFPLDNITYLFGIILPTIVTGVSGGMIMVVAYSIICREIEGKVKNLAFAGLLALMTFGMIPLYFALFIIMTPLSIIGFFLPALMGALVLVAAILLAAGAGVVTFFLIKTHPEPDAKFDMVGSFSKVLNRPTFIAFCVAMFIIWMFIGMETHLRVSYMSSYIMSINSIDEMMIGFTLVGLVSPMVMLFGYPLVAYIFRRKEPTYVVMVSALICIFALLFMQIPRLPFVLMALLAVFFVGYVAFYPLFLSSMSRWADPKAPAVTMSIVFAVMVAGERSGEALAELTTGPFYDLGVPMVLWTIALIIGLVGVVAYWFFSRSMSVPPLDTGDEKGRTALEPTPQLKRIVGSPVTLIVAAVLVPGLILGGIFGVAFDVEGMGSSSVNSGGGGGDWSDLDWQNWEYIEETSQITGYLDEGTEEFIDLSILSSHVESITVTLTWEDEPDQRILLQQGENQPDEFSLDLTDGNKSVRASAANEREQPGLVEVNMAFDLNDLDTNTQGEYLVTVACVNAGDHTPRIAGPLMRNDTGNEWSMIITVGFYSPPEP